MEPDASGRSNNGWSKSMANVTDFSSRGFKTVFED